MRDLQCCPDGGEKKLDGSYPSTGEIIQVGDMRIYVTGTGDNVVVVCHDIFGFDGGRTQ